MKKVVITVDLSKVKVRKKMVPITKVFELKTKKLKKIRMNELLESL